MHKLTICLAAVAALVALPAHAQNKCTDKNGKVFYQQDPCPGTVVRPAPAPAAPAKPAAAKPAAGKPAAPAQSPKSAKAAPAPKRDEAKCAELGKQRAENRAAVEKMTPSQRESFEGRARRTESDYARNC